MVSKYLSSGIFITLCGEIESKKSTKIEKSLIDKGANVALSKLFYRGSYSCFIEFIKRVEEKRYNVRLAKHSISLSQRV